MSGAQESREQDVCGVFVGVVFKLYFCMKSVLSVSLLSDFVLMLVDCLQLGSPPFC